MTKPKLRYLGNIVGKDAALDGHHQKAILNHAHYLLIGDKVYGCAYLNWKRYGWMRIPLRVVRKMIAKGTIRE